MKASALFASMAYAVTACDDLPPSASKERIGQYLQRCQIAHTRIEKGHMDAETTWVVGMGVQPQAKWDCFQREQERDGVRVTAWGQVKEPM